MYYVESFLCGHPLGASLKRWGVDMIQEMRPTELLVVMDTLEHGVELADLELKGLDELRGHEHRDVVGTANRGSDEGTFIK